MLLAHLRGLLRPETPRNYVAIAAENMVLLALEREVDASYLDTLALSEMMAATCPRGIRKEMAESSIDKAEAAYYNRTHNLLDWREKGSRDSVNKMIEAYNALEKAGVIK